MSQENLSLRFWTRSHTNRAVQPLKIARLWLEILDLGSRRLVLSMLQNKGADQLRGNHAPDLCLCFRISKCRYFLAHLSRRLIGELIGYPCSGVHPSSVRPSTISKIFSETAWPIKAKFYVEPPWVGGTKVCSQHPGHMTKMAATSIYGKNSSKSFTRTGRPISTKLGM